MNDFKFAFRQLLKNPGFTALAAIALLASWLLASVGAARGDEVRTVSDSSPPLSVGRTNIVSRDEPGDRLVVHGTIFETDGKTPVTNAVLRIYHTDASGVYSREANDATDERNPRLRASLRTDANGHYEVHTIMPGRYPGGKTPAHIHILVSAPGYPEQNATFSISGDPALTAEDYEKHGRDGTFSAVRPAERGPDGALRCQRDIRFAGRKDRAAQNQTIHERPQIRLPPTSKEPRLHRPPSGVLLRRTECSPSRSASGRTPPTSNPLEFHEPLEPAQITRHGPVPQARTRRGDG